MANLPLTISEEKRSIIQSLQSRLFLIPGDRSAFAQPKKLNNLQIQGINLIHPAFTPEKAGLVHQNPSYKRKTKDISDIESYDSSENEKSSKKTKKGEPTMEDVSDFVKSRLNEFLSDEKLFGKSTPKKNWWTAEEVQSIKFRTKNSPASWTPLEYSSF